jgi:hypothetical protein
MPDRHSPDSAAPDSAAPCSAAPDRYADAVRARRAELRNRLARLAGGHRSELRTAIALSRVSATADAGAVLAGIARDARALLESADRAARLLLPAALGAALADAVAGLHAGWVLAVGPPLRRIATERALPMEPGWPRPPAPRPLPALPPPAPVGAVRSLLAGAVQGAALWRLLVVPLAVLPLWGLPVLGGPRFAPLAAGTGLVAVVVAARARRAAAERAGLRRHVDDVLASARAALDADLGRRLLELEHTAGTALDAAVARRRADVEAELSQLSRRAGSTG